MITPTGMLNINKSRGLTSRDVVDRVVRALRRLTGNRKVKAGHCGTLDPLATGVLVVCTGQATRLVTLIQEFPKTYRGRFLLGRVTNTDDVTGQTIRESDIAPDTFTRDDIEALLPEFTGRIAQIPPQFSAVHVNGKRAYKLARRGADVKLEPRPVEIHRLAIESFDYPEFELLIECGSGTYVRSIGRDIGERLGCGATMSSLIRTSIGPFPVENAIALGDLTEHTLTDYITPAVSGVRHLPSMRIDAQQAALIRNGREIPFRPQDVRPPEVVQAGVTTSESRTVLILNDEELVSISEPGRAPGTLKPAIVFKDGT
jgi:tRNA pseudouridine55 synthase